MPLSVSEILSALQNGVEAINNLSATFSSFFPQATSLSTSVTVGAITYNSSQATAFLIVTTSTGGTYKVPLYSE